MEHKEVRDFEFSAQLPKHEVIVWQTLTFDGLVGIIPKNAKRYATFCARYLCELFIGQSIAT